ncbi:MAG: T9SS type A sorting domain-containing protein [Flavobacteriales bacterium]
MRIKSILISIFVISQLHGLCQLPELVWAHNLGFGISTEGDDQINYVEFIPENGHLIVAGRMGDSLDIDLGDNELFLVGGVESGFFVEYDENLNVVDYAFMGDEVFSAHIYGDQFYVMGRFAGTNDFDITENQLLVTAPGTAAATDIFIASYNKNDHSLANLAQCSGEGVEGLAEVSWGEQDIYLGGVSGTVNSFIYRLNGDILFEYPAEYLGFFFHLSLDLNTIQYKLFEDDYQAQIRGVLHNDEHTIALGHFSGTMEFGWEGNVMNSQTVDDGSAFVACYSSDHILQHLMTVKDNTTNTCLACGHGASASFDQNGNLYVTLVVAPGQVLISVDGETFEYNTSDFTYGGSAIAIKLNSDFEIVWIRKCDFGGNYYSHAMSADRYGGIHFSGSHFYNLDWIEDDISLPGGSPSGHYYSYAQDGDISFALVPNCKNVYAVCPGDETSMYIAGNYAGTSMDVNPDPDFTETLPDAAGIDGFLVKYNQPMPSPEIYVEHPMSPLDASEDGSTDILKISLLSVPASQVNIIADPDPQLDLGAGPGQPITLEFAPNFSACLQQSIPISAYDDLDSEGEHSGTITFSINTFDEDYSTATINAQEVSIADNDTESIQEKKPVELTLSPNPANDQLIINLSKSNHPITQLDIINGSGQIVSTLNPLSDILIYDTSRISEGVYIVRCYIDSGEFVSRKFEIVRR